VLAIGHWVLGFALELVLPAKVYLPVAVTSLNYWRLDPSVEHFREHLYAEAALLFTFFW